MINVSEAYKSAVKSSVRTDRITGNITLCDGNVINITDDSIVNNSVELKEQLVSGDKIEIGTFYTNQLNVTVYGDIDSNYANAIITLYYGLQLADGTWEDIPLGIFTVDNSYTKRRGNTHKLVGFDNSIKFDVDIALYDSRNKTVEQHIRDIAQYVNVTLATIDFSAFPNSDIVVNGNKAGIQTCRDMVEWCSALLGASARINRYGELEILQIKEKTIDGQYNFDVVITGNERLGTEFFDLRSLIKYVSSTHNGKQLISTTNAYLDDYYGRNAVIFLPENPLLNDYPGYASVLDSIASSFTVALRMADFSFIGNPAIECYDTIGADGGQIDVGRTIAVFPSAMSWKYRGKHRITCAYAQITDESTLPIATMATEPSKTPLAVKSKTDKRIDGVNNIACNAGGVGQFTNDSHTSERFNDYQNNTATGVFSHTEGYSNKNDGDFSHVGGNNNKLTSGTASFVSGMLNTVAGDFNGVTGNTNSVTGDNNGAEGLSNSITGDCSHAEGQSNTITSDFSHGEGFGNKASGDSSHTEGQGNTSSGFASHTEGYSNTASGSYSHAEGSTNKAEGESSHAEGFRSNATKSYSHAEGLQTNSVAEASHSEGGFTTAEGNFSHAEGMGAKATGQNSHAEGNYTTASGEGSHTEGLRTEARGNYSHAGGEYTIVTAKSGTAIGRYNLSTDKLFVVGNGNYEQRSDALTLDEAGNLFVAGSINAAGGIEVELPISDVISDTSTNNTAAGSKAVYDYTQQNFVKVGDISDWAMQPNKPTYTATEVNAAAKVHTHSKADITDFPASLPASGGNADTVDGKHAIDFAEAEHTHSEYLPLSGGDMTGTLTLPAGLVNDATTNSPSFIIGSKTSYHVEFSNSVIQIKNGDKAEGALYLNRYGGNIGIGDEESSILFCNARVKITPDGFTTSKKLIALAGIEGNITNATNADMVDGKHATDLVPVIKMGTEPVTLPYVAGKKQAVIEMWKVTPAYPGSQGDFGVTIYDSELITGLSSSMTAILTKPISTGSNYSFIYSVSSTGKITIGGDFDKYRVTYYN